MRRCAIGCKERLPCYPFTRAGGVPAASAKGVSELSAQNLDGAARAAGELELPLALGLEAAIAQALAPGLDGLADRVEIERIAPDLAGAGHHVGRHANERAQRRAGL